MKKLIIGLAVFMMIACAPDAPEFPWSKLSFADAQQSAGDKMIMLDFYTDW